MKFKSIDTLSISECCAELNIENQQLPAILENIIGPQEIIDRLSSLLDADMSAFRSCSTIEQYKRYLALWTDGLHREEAAQRVAQLKAEAEEGVSYKKCKDSISGCEAYLKKYPTGHYVNKVSILLDDLFYKNCFFKSDYEQYLAKFPKGQHVKEAREKIKQIDKKKCIIIIIIITAIILFVLGYNRAGSITFANVQNTEQADNSKLKIALAYSSPRTLTLPLVVISKATDEKILYFPKEGGVKEVSFTSGASNDNIEVTSSTSWINATKTSDGKVKISVSKNTGAKRKGFVEVKAYSTLFGIRTSSTTGIINIEQSTGYASYINVSSDDITFDKNGGTKDIRIESDGYYQIEETCPSWMNISKHNNILTFTVEENAETSRTYKYEIESGSIKRNIKISQAGKLATRLSVSTSDVEFGANGGSTTIEIYTDGEWHISTGTDDWGRTSISGNTITLTVGVNNGEYRTDYFVIKSGSYEKRINISQAGKAATHLSASPDYLSFSSSGGTRTITVSTDGEWYISTGTDDWGRTSINGNTITLKVLENPSSGSRTDYFVIKSGSKEKRINISQDGKPATRLSVSTENVSFGKDGGRRTITVSTNGEWRIGVGTVSWAHTSISGNTITLRVDENNSGDERTDYFTVVAGDKEVRIDISQEGGPSAEINRIRQKHNVINGYSKGLQIEVEFDVSNMKGKRVTATALFYYGDNTTPLNSARGGQVSISKSDTAPYTNTTFTMNLFIPYQNLNMAPGWSGNLSFDIVIKDSNGKKLARENNQSFTYSQGAWFY